MKKPAAVLLFLFSLALVSSQSGMDFFSALICVWAVITTVVARRWAAWRTPLNWFLLATFVHIALGYAWNAVPAEYATPGLLEFRWMFVLLALTFAFRSVELADMQWFLLPLVLGAAYSVLTYLLGYSPLHEGPEAIAANTSYLWRSGGLMNDAMSWSHTVGPAFCLITVGFLALLYRQVTSSRSVLVGGMVIAITSLAVLFTMTRGVWVAVALSIPLTLMTLDLRKGLIVLAAVCGLAGAVAAVVPEVRNRILFTFNYEKTHDSERIVLWKANAAMVADAPWLGLGYGENRRRLREYYDKQGVPEGQFESHAHNQYLQFAAGNGVPGALLYLSFIGYLLFASLTQRYTAHAKGNYVQEALMVGLFAAILCFALGGLTEANFSIAKNRYLFLFLAAMVLRGTSTHSGNSPESKVVK